MISVNYNCCLYICFQVIYEAARSSVYSPYETRVMIGRENYRVPLTNRLKSGTTTVEKCGIQIKVIRKFRSLLAQTTLPTGRKQMPKL